MSSLEEWETHALPVLRAVVDRFPAGSTVQQPRGDVPCIVLPDRRSIVYDINTDTWDLWTAPARTALGWQPQLGESTDLDGAIQWAVQP